MIDAIVLAIIAVMCFAAGLLGGLVLFSMAAAASRDSRMRENMEEKDD